MSAKTSVVKLRLVVDERTASILDSQSRMCNWLYNQLVVGYKRLPDKTGIYLANNEYSNTS